MFLEKLSQFGVAALDGAARGAHGWWQNSDVTWLATGSVYFGLQLVNGTKYSTGLDAGQAATAVATIGSLYTFIKGCNSEAKGNVDAEKPAPELKNKTLLVLTNAAALGLYALSRRGVTVPAYQALILTAISYGVARFGHNTAGFAPDKV